MRFGATLRRHGHVIYAAKRGWTRLNFAGAISALRFHHDGGAMDLDASNNKEFWSKDPKTGKPTQRPIFIAATKQHVGKTTVSLALMSGLQKRFEKVGFIKPVGQQHVKVQGNNGDELRVDKDVVLVREYFNLDHADYGDMSPVLIPRGYTKKYVDGEIDFEKQIMDVKTSMRRIADSSEIVMLEGTGHCAVGSIVGLNNAVVANILGADMVLIANGGLGKAFDELELNRVLCQHHGVRIAGVIINKVIPEKLEQTKYYMGKVLKEVWGIPLLGCVPDRPFLGCPALADLERLFKTELVCGQQHRFRHYSPLDANVVTTSLARFLENMRTKSTRTLYICHATRDDLIVGFLSEFHRQRSDHGKPSEAALLVCCRQGKYQLSKEVKDLLDAGKNGPPIMVVEESTNIVMNKIHGLTPKLNIDDPHRVGIAVDHYEPYIDFDMLWQRTRA